ncbi:MAG: hypothetical protein QW666_03130 [Candidatus Woesearchaeota archaeon]
MGVAITDAKNIPVELIVEDQIGDYKKPTPESIEDRLNDAENQAKKGDYRFENAVRICRNLAKKIGYTLDEKRIESFGLIARDASLRNFEKSLPELVKAILRDSYAFNLELIDGASPYEGTGLSENVDHLFKNLADINLPDDVKLKKQILAIHFMYKEMWENYAKAAELKKKRIQEKMDKRISLCQGNSLEASKMISAYCQRAGIDEYGLDEIAEKSGIPHPCDSEEDIDKLFPF